MPHLLPKISAPLVLAAICLAGCASNESVEQRVQEAYQAGYQEGRRAAEVERTHIFLRGPFQQASIAWRQGLTIAQAIVEAVYTSPNDPIAITLTRQGRVIPIDPKNLLRGIDPPLEPGDTLELR